MTFSSITIRKSSERKHWSLANSTLLLFLFWISSWLPPL
jgi:hypothetical protein